MDSKPTPSGRPVLQPIPPVNAFDAWCIRLNRLNTEIAMALGMTNEMVGQYRKGQRRPSYDSMLVIRDVSGGEVSLESWALASVA